MGRIALEDDKRELVVVSREDFLKDWERGYCAIEVQPERDNVLVDRRTRREIHTHTDRVVAFRCMKCAFDVCDSALTKEKGEVRTAISVMQKHLANDQHSWPYKPFHNPYGHIADIMIEGIENYAAEIGDL